MTFLNGFHGEMQKRQKIGRTPKNEVFIKRERREIFKRNYFPNASEVLVHTLRERNRKIVVYKNYR